MCITVICYVLLSRELSLLNRIPVLVLVLNVHVIDKHVEIKCQLDATDEFLLQILLLAQHVSGTIMSIIRSSRVLYKWFPFAVFGAGLCVRFAGKQ
jgi:hypothetical protein